MFQKSVCYHGAIYLAGQEIFSAMFDYDFLRCSKVVTFLRLSNVFY